MSNNLPITGHLSDDLLFLIACCQTDPSKDDIEFIHSYLSAEALNTNTLIGLATRHGILPLVYKTIKKLSEDDSQTIQHAALPDQEMPLGCNISPSGNAPGVQHFLSELKPLYMSIVQRNMLMTSELIRIMHLLRENNIEALAFKGPSLSQMAHGDITLRQYSDLDVLTRKEDVHKIDALLKAQGYERLLALTPAQEKIWIKYTHDMGLIHPEKNVHFEMHWSFLDEDYPMQVDLEDFWKETQEVVLNGHPVPTFSNENLIVYLSIHGSKHLWERIEWIKDIDLLICKNEIDWKKVIEKTNGTGFEKMVYLGLYLNASLFNTPLPGSIQKEIEKYPQIEQLSTFILESWDTPKSTFQKTSATLKLFPGIKEKLIYLHKIILKPSFNEYWYIYLPKGFYWLYYFLRPYLLIKKYFTKQEV